MSDEVNAALRVTHQLRSSAGWRALDRAQRARLDADLSRIEETLGADPYAQALDVMGFQERLRAGAATEGGAEQQPAAAPSPSPPAAQTREIGERAGAALASVNFPAFVASLITGTFQAIVDASAQQVQEYAKLVASISQSAGSFSRENVSLDQTRDELAAKHPRDLMVVLPRPGARGVPKLLPRPARRGTSPDWLVSYGLEGEELSEELTEGALLDAGRAKVGEERLQTLATMVLMGINRIVVNEGDIRARMQFHASAVDKQRAQVEQQGLGIAGRGVGGGSQTQMMVSTMRANAQADASIKADLMGEVRVSFRSETFPLERFADSAAIQLLNRHARFNGEASRPEGAAVAPPAALPPKSGEPK